MKSSPQISQNLYDKVKKLAANNDDVLLLTTIPGVGAITALSFISAVGNPKRFTNLRNVGAYFGLTPKQYSSGEVHRQSRISKRGSMDVRSLLVEAVHVMLTHSKSCSEIKSWAMRIASKKGTKKTSVALARKLSVIMARMLITKKPFIYGKKEGKKQLE